MIYSIQESLTMSKKDLINLLDKGCSQKGENSWLFIPKGIKSLKGKICLVAHIDTVWDTDRNKIRSLKRVKNKKLLIHDKEKELIYSPDGLGADDRAGVYSLFNIWNSFPPKSRPILLFTDLEESGGEGAKEASTIFENELSQISHFIELDRQGERDCVFYGDEPLSYIKHIESYGFEQSCGSFSDISILGPKLGKCCVNLSIGYYNQHTEREYLSLKDMNSTIGKVLSIVKDTNKSPKEWILDETSHTKGSRMWWDNVNYFLDESPYLEDVDILQCEFCKESILWHEAISFGGVCPMCGHMVDLKGCQ